MTVILVGWFCQQHKTQHPVCFVCMYWENDTKCVQLTAVICRQCTFRNFIVFHINLVHRMHHYYGIILTCEPVSKVELYGGGVWTHQ